MYCFFEFKLCYLKNLKLFSIRVKELFEPIVLQKKNRKERKNYGKNAKLGREICTYLKIDSVETNCGVRQVITIICVVYVQKDF